MSHMILKPAQLPLIIGPVFIFSGFSLDSNNYSYFAINSRILNNIAPFFLLYLHLKITFLLFILILMVSSKDLGNCSSVKYWIFLKKFLEHRTTTATVPWKYGISIKPISVAHKYWPIVSEARQGKQKWPP